MFDESDDNIGKLLFYIAIIPAALLVAAGIPASLYCLGAAAVAFGLSYLPAPDAPGSGGLKKTAPPARPGL